MLCYELEKIGICQLKLTSLCLGIVIKYNISDKPSHVTHNKLWESHNNCFQPVAHGNMSSSGNLNVKHYLSRSKPFTYKEKIITELLYKSMCFTTCLQIFVTIHAFMTLV